MGCTKRPVDPLPQTVTNVNHTVKGEIKIDGSSTVYPISQRVSELFADEFPNVNIKVDFGGTSAGFRRLFRGEIDLADASRPIKNKELKSCQKTGCEFIELPVAFDGLTIVINKRNDWVTQLSIEELQAIFLADRAAKTWKDVRPEWPNEKIELYIPGHDSGTYDYFQSVVSGGRKLRDDAAYSEDDEILVKRIAERKHSLGFFGLAYYLKNKDSLQPVAIVNPESQKAILPDTQSVADGTYAPFGRPLFVYVNKSKLQSPAVKSFVSFYLGQAEKVASEVGCVPLPSHLLERSKQCLKQQTGGTCFIDSDGEKRVGSLESIYQSQNRINE